MDVWKRMDMWPHTTLGKHTISLDSLDLQRIYILNTLNTSDSELRRLAQFNLYLIYKKNNTMKLFKNIVDKDDLE